MNSRWSCCACAATIDVLDATSTALAPVGKAAGSRLGVGVHPKADIGARAVGLAAVAVLQLQCSRSIELSLCSMLDIFRRDVLAQAACIPLSSHIQCGAAWPGRAVTCCAALLKAAALSSHDSVPLSGRPASPDTTAQRH